MRLAVIASHPVQYYAPLFRALARRIDLKVFFAHYATPADQAKAGFGVGFDWDIDLLADYEHWFLRNVAREPGLDHFGGCDTPEFASLLAQGRFDAVLLMGWHLKSSVQALLAAKRLGIPVMARGDSHLQTPRRLLKKLVKVFAYPPFLRLFDAALYVGEQSRAYWQHYRYPSERLFFSPHCVEAEWFATRATSDARADLRARLGLNPKSTAVLFAGKLLPFKRPLDLIAAASRLKSRRSPVDVVVVGSGPMQSEIIGAAANADVSCHMLGFRNQSEMPGVYSAADILVLPSDGRETWGLVANEALACARPIVVSDAVGCALDLASDGSAGRVFALGDIEALAAAISDILDHPPQADAIAAKSAAYSIDAAVEGVLHAAAFAISYRHRTAI